MKQIRLNTGYGPNINSALHLDNSYDVAGLRTSNNGLYML